jgi:hypothetical protein
MPISCVPDFLRERLTSLLPFFPISPDTAFLDQIFRSSSRFFTKSQEKNLEFIKEAGVSASCVRNLTHFLTVASLGDQYYGFKLLSGGMLSFYLNALWDLVENEDPLVVKEITGFYRFYVKSPYFFESFSFKLSNQAELTLWRQVIGKEDLMQRPHEALKKLCFLEAPNCDTSEYAQFQELIKKSLTLNILSDYNFSYFWMQRVYLWLKPEIQREILHNILNCAEGKEITFNQVFKRLFFFHGYPDFLARLICTPMFNGEP